MRKTLIQIGLLLFRVALGAFMAVHGWQKVAAYGDLVEKFPDPIGMGSQLSLIAAIGAELGCSILIILGFATRLAAVPLAFTMVIALFVVHGEDPWKVKELAAFYLAFRLHKQRLSLVSVGLIALQRFCYRQLLYWVAIEALLAALRGRLTGWGRIRRFGLEPVAHPDTKMG